MATQIKGKTNAGLVAYAKAQLGLPYWYGTFGQIATESLYLDREYHYPDFYLPWSDFAKQYGKRVHDCVGLVKGYMWSDTPTSIPNKHYNSKQDVSACGMYSNSTLKGTISNFPAHVGQLVYKSYDKNNAKRIHHVGVYIGDGYVIEAKGHEYGVVKTKFEGAGWTHWSQCPYISDTVSIASYSSDFAGIYKVTGALVNLRAGVGTSEKIIKILTKGTEVQCDGCFVNLNGTVWYHVTAKSSSKTYEGFMSEKYLKPI